MPPPIVHGDGDSKVPWPLGPNSSLAIVVFFGCTGLKIKRCFVPILISTKARMKVSFKITKQPFTLICNRETKIQLRKWIAIGMCNSIREVGGRKLNVYDVQSNKKANSLFLKLPIFNLSSRLCKFVFVEDRIYFFLTKNSVDFDNIPERTNFVKFPSTCKFAC